METKAISKTKGLQKLTESQIIFNKMMENESIVGSGLKGSSKEVILEVISLTVDMIYELRGNERDRFIEKFDVLLFDDIKNQIWENNHMLITQAISKHSSTYNAIPNQSQIAEETGISRQTVSKHLKDYSNNPLFIAQTDQLKVMGMRVMGRVLESALCGDMKAARLYFDMTGAGQSAGNTTSIKNQNNYIQINGTVLDQDRIKQLSPEQLNQIEGILKLAVPIPKAIEI